MLTLHKDKFRKIPEAVARVFSKLGFTPNGITLLSLVLGLLTSILFVWNRNPILFGLLMIVWGLFDSVDGALARLTHQASKFGSYLDAMCDRIFEAAAVLAAAFVTGYWVLSFLLIVGSMAVSYAKARAAMEVPVSNTEWPDFMERTERDLVFAIGIVLWGFFPRLFWGHDLFFWTLGALNLCVYYTLVQRIIRASRLIRERQ